jgi:alpha/beta superfamily hydrolase
VDRGQDVVGGFHFGSSVSSFAQSRPAERLVAPEMEAQAGQLMSLSRAEKKEVVVALDRLIDVFRV